MRRGKLGWRAADRRFRALSQALARRAAQSAAESRECVALLVCPDGDSCLDPRCVRGREAARAGADWRTVFDIINEGKVTQ